MSNASPRPPSRRGAALCRWVLVGCLLAPVAGGAATLTPNAPPPAAAVAPAPPVDAALAAAIASPARSPAFVPRDAARHPQQELAFFGLTPGATVVEIWPDGGYWTEILAPYLREGHYIAALQGPGGGPDSEAEAARDATKFRAKIEADPQHYGGVVVTELGVGRTDIASPGSADFVLTFRNLHNWMAHGDADQALAAFYRALKPGGVLGMEEHRGNVDQPQDPRAASGYVREDYAIALAKRAGFTFEAASEINANPKDTANWPRGVWTLPPRLILGDQDRARYLAIGEADNFVLRFRKPGA